MYYALDMGITLKPVFINIIFQNKIQSEFCFMKNWNLRILKLLIFDFYTWLLLLDNSTDKSQITGLRSGLHSLQNGSTVNFAPQILMFKYP